MSDQSNPDSAMSRFLSVQVEIANAEELVANLRLELNRIRKQSPIVNEMSTKNALLNMSLSDTKAFQDAWKDIIEGGLYQNVINILSDCQLDPDCVGKSDSEPDVRFVLSFIRYMKSTGWFGNVNDSYGLEDFADTAGGCDETLGDALIEFLKVPNRKPWDFAEEAAKAAAKKAAMTAKDVKKAAEKVMKAAEKATKKAMKAVEKAEVVAAKKAEKVAIKAELAAAKKASHV
jgi:hypothetical protein